MVQGSKNSTRVNRANIQDPINPEVFHSVIYPFLGADEMTHIAVLHEWQNHQGEPFFRQHDAQQRQYVKVVETFHDDALSEELVHLAQICDPC